MGEQDRVHALLQARAVADEMKSPARPLALGVSKVDNQITVVPV